MRCPLFTLSELGRELGVSEAALRTLLGREARYGRPGPKPVIARARTRCVGQAKYYDKREFLQWFRGVGSA